ncbi:hypothetical protein TREES_T100006791 [Tupaia chinensis]|uniref:Uncharacterized protein n=1 Tax=Tupaia chinensis TaxID=246437 RepID=L9KEG3_TUPCH|nr:hypothetical protein TREES_T100006791 [Tupaia chinensis]
MADLGAVFISNTVFKEKQLFSLENSSKDAVTSGKKELASELVTGALGLSGKASIVSSGDWRAISLDFQGQKGEQHQEACENLHEKLINGDRNLMEMPWGYERFHFAESNSKGL